MNLIRTTTLEYPRSLWQLRRDNPDVSFPSEPSDSDLAPFDHANVHSSPQPTGYNHRTERVEEAAPMCDADGTWRQSWIIRSATTEEIAAYDQAHRQPDWTRFKAHVLANPGINAALATALTTVPAAATALAPTLLRAEQGDVTDFAAAWAAVMQAAPLAPEVLTELVSLALDCNLPQEFVEAL
jgi:hypothetical protein